jgi:hypothetical protein
MRLLTTHFLTVLAISLSVRATRSEVVIALSATPTQIFATASRPVAECRIVQLSAHTIGDSAANERVLWEGNIDRTPVAFDRFIGSADGLYKRYELRDRRTGEAFGTAQWVTDLSQTGPRGFAFLKTTTKKGLNAVTDIEDARALGSQHANANISMRSLLALDVSNSEFSTSVDGEEVRMNSAYVRHLDGYIGGMTAAGMNVTGVLLNIFDPKASRDQLIHPTTNMAEAPNRMGAFNVTSPEGLRFYRAAVQFLVERYTRPDRAHGWMSGLIIGNEVQSHWFWHNQGDVSPHEVLRDYHVALRIADLVGRSVHSHYQVFISMDHHWTRSMTGFQRTRSMPGDHFLEVMTTLSREGGDFPWSLAFHPYPENLFEPRFWNDRRAPHAMDAPVITFRNIEVLPAAMRDPNLRYAGKARRLALTEQGFHRKAGSEGEEMQAAALALGYWKINQIAEIDFFLLHRHQDHPHEGGLNLGVLDQRKRRTRAWEVFQSLDTPAGESTSTMALKAAGIADRAAATVSTAIAPRSRLNGAAADNVFDFFEHASAARLTDVADFRAGEVKTGETWSRSILQHPKAGKLPARAAYSVLLPSVPTGSRLLFEFSTAIEAESHDGVGFRVVADGESLLKVDQAVREPQPRKLDLTRFAGRQVTIELVVDSIGNTVHDLAAWVDPRIVVQR